LALAVAAAVSGAVEYLRNRRRAAPRSASL
jgi:hypothetical protein